MAKICLPPKVIESFRSAIASGKLNPAELSQLSSDERNAYFTKLVGKDYAQFVNAGFESKILMKNQKTAYISWAKKVAGITPEVRRDLISRIEKLDRVLDPAENEQFLKDLAATKLGYGVSEAEAKQIANMSQKVSELKGKRKPDGTFASETDRLNYGRAKVDLGAYVSDLKNAANKGKLSDIYMHPAKTVTNVASLTKSMKASLDNSAIFRQGWKTMFTNPKEWAKNSAKTFKDITKELKGQDAMREVTADIVSRPNYDLYQKAKLATATVEEEFPSQLPEKIPGVKRLFKASESAYTGFLHRQRADVFDKYVEVAKKQGVNLDDNQLQSMGKLVNALTGRGHLGGLEPAANTVNSIFFSPRSVKANIDTLTAHQFQKGTTAFVRKQAAKNLVKVVTGTAAVMAIANLVRPGSVEFDPRSSDFGKIKVGNTRFDLTGGMSSIASLAARLASQSSKSSTTGGISKLNSGYGSQTGVDVISNFLENKLSPAASVVKEVFLNHKDFNGNPVTVGGTLNNALTPLPIANAVELSKEKNGANVLVGALADAFGIAANTYSAGQKNWNVDTGAKLTQFKEKFGNGKFKEANEKYNKLYDDWYNGKAEVANVPTLSQVSKEEREDLIKRAKTDIQDYVLHEYGFKYEKSQAEKDETKAKAKETRERNKARNY